MNTITLTLEATPENLRLISQLLLGEATVDQAVIPQEKPKPAKKKEEPKPVEEKKEEPKSSVTKSELRAKGIELTKAGKSEDLKDALSEFGASKLSQVKEEDYADLMKKLEEIS